MSNENKIRILYVQPGKYPEERLAANELHPLEQLVGGVMQAVYPFRGLHMPPADPVVINFMSTYRKKS